MTAKPLLAKAASVALFAPTESVVLTPLLQALRISEQAAGLVLAIGLEPALEKLRGVAPPPDASQVPGDLLTALSCSRQGFSTARGRVQVVALGGTTESVQQAATSVKLQPVGAGAFDTWASGAVKLAFEDAAAALRGELATRLGPGGADTPARVAVLLATASCAPVDRALVGAKVELGFANVVALLQRLPHDADVQPLAQHARALSELDAEHPITVRSGLLPLLRLAGAGGEAEQLATARAREYLGAALTSGVLPMTFPVAARLVPDLRDKALAWLFQNIVWSKLGSFLFVSYGRLAGHEPYCDCKGCVELRATELGHAIVAIQPDLGALTKDTRALLDKVLAMRGIDPIGSILRQWAAPSSAPLAPPKNARSPSGRPTPNLDKAEALLAELTQAKTAKRLSALEKKFGALEPSDLVDEDPHRWQELLERVTEHRDVFAHGTSEQAIVQSILDALSSS